MVDELGLVALRIFEVELDLVRIGEVGLSWLKKVQTWREQVKFLGLISFVDVGFLSWGLVMMGEVR